LVKRISTREKSVQEKIGLKVTRRDRIFGKKRGEGNPLPNVLIGSAQYAQQRKCQGGPQRIAPRVCPGNPKKRADSH